MIVLSLNAVFMPEDVLRPKLPDTDKTNTDKRFVNFFNQKISNIFST